MTPVERVARAIGEAVYGYCTPDDTPNTWVAALSAAQAAIEAMRVPSEAMVMESRISDYVVKQALAAPSWDEAGRVHDWRNHVGRRTRSVWHSFTDEQKIAIAGDADDRAGMEEWD